MSGKLKVIHTSDWHLGHRLYNYDRTDEELQFLADMAEVVKEEQPDALLISGDIYHTCSPGNEVARMFTDSLLEIQSQCPTMEIIVTAGNHDSYSRLEIDQSLWKRCHVRILGTPAEKEDGTADYEKNIIVLKDNAQKAKGIIAAVPFCHPRNFPTTETTTADAPRDKEYFQGLAQAVRDANKEHLPTVLMAHLAVGSDTSFTGQERDNVIGGQECVAPDTLGTGYDYVALGHIHCPQWVKTGDKKFVRYSGTPRPIHFDEEHQHGVDVVEIEAGKEPVLRTVALTPYRGLHTIGGKEGLPFEDALKSVAEEAQASHWHEGDYIRLNVSLEVGQVQGGDWLEKARQAAENCKLRFCCINYILRQDTRADDGERPVMNLQEIKDLEDEDVLEILDRECQFTEEQKELLKGLMADLNAKRNQ